MDTFVTVIVPVRNEESHLEASLRPLLEQIYPTNCFEIIVVDGRSSDGTRDIVRRLQSEYVNLRLLDNPKRLSSAGRNVGVRQARGDYVVIVDGHCELRNPFYMRDLVWAFARHGVDCLGRPQPLDVRGATLVQRAIALARSSRLGHNPGSHIYSDAGGIVKPQSVGVAYRRGVFDLVGHFDEGFDACEDVEFNHRVDAAGLTCYLAPELTVHYRPRETLGGLAFQMQRYGRGRARLLLKHPDTFSPLSLLPAMFCVGIAASFVMGVTTPVFAALFCLTAIVYSMCITLAGLWLAARCEAALLAPLMPAAFLAIHVGAGWGVLAELAPSVFRRILRRIRPLARDLRPTR